MNKVLIKRILLLALAALMVLMLAACEVSSSSTSTTTISTSVTDAEGNTTTNTTTTEIGASVGTDGVKTTNQTTTQTTTTPASGEENSDAEQSSKADDRQAFIDHMYETYNGGAEGRNKDGDYFYYGFHDETDNAIVVIVTADGQNYFGREGLVMDEDDHYVLHSEVMEDDTPIAFSEQDDNGDFTITFLGDGDVADMKLVDFDTFVNDVLARIEEFQ